MDFETASSRAYNIFREIECGAGKDRRNSCERPLGVLPTFEIRWDEKDDTLDVDATGHVSRVQVAKSEQVSTEFYGHHTKRVNTGPRVFETDIGWRGQKIYSGQIGFNLEREMESGVPYDQREPSVSEKLPNLREYLSGISAISWPME